MIAQLFHIRSRCCVPQSKGFTLVELLVVLAIFSSVLGVVFSSLGEDQKLSQIAREEIEIHQNLQDVLSLITSELRFTGFPPESFYDISYLQNPSTNKNLVAQGLVLIGPQEIRFQGDINGDNVVDYVRYYLSGATAPYVLNRFAGSINTDGSLPGGSPQKLCEQVQSLQFRYFNNSGIETSVLSDISTIQIELTLRTKNLDPLTRIYHTMSESTRVRPLNL